MNFDKQGWIVTNNIVEDYLKCCKNSVIDTEFFNSFRSNEEYRRILEHSTQKMGQECLNEIKENDKIYNFYKTYSQEDNIGNPIKYYYDDSTKSSPTTLKYITVLKHLIDNFGSLNDFNIIEVGGGYGGQCKIIQEFSSIKSYTIIDLYWPLKLQEKFINNNDKINFIETKDIKKMSGTFDLFISNYAFTELNEETQSLIYNKIIKNCNSCYMTCNFVNHEFIKKFDNDFNIVKKNDLESENARNFILIMRKKNNV